MDPSALALPAIVGGTTLALGAMAVLVARVWLARVERRARLERPTEPLATEVLLSPEERDIKRRLASSWLVNLEPEGAPRASNHVRCVHRGDHLLDPRHPTIASLMGHRLSAVLYQVTPPDSPQGEQLAFWCPGCDAAHVVRTTLAKGSGPKWRWNQLREAPSFDRSLRVRINAYVDDTTGDIVVGPKTLCHCKVRLGRIQFSKSSVHNLAGQTVDMVGWPT